MNPPQWDQVVTCRLCGHTSHAQYKRTGYRPGEWLCLSAARLVAAGG